MRTLLLAALIFTSSAYAAEAHHEEADPRQVPQTAFALLVAGNKDYAAGHPHPTDLSQGHIKDLSAGQKPYAAILGCADSRTPPEHVFGAGIGDLFVVRGAGNVADEDEVASMEYAVAHLGVKVIVVMGHTSCGAVKAAIADAHDTPAITGLVADIHPAVDAAKKDGDADLVDRTAATNAALQRDNLLKSPLLSEKEKAGEIKILTARYDLKDGVVTWLNVDGLAKP